jgi:HD-GYP domain
MRRVQIDNVDYGAKLAKTIFNSDGGVLLSAGLEIRDSFIQKLVKYGIREIYIEDDFSSDLQIKDAVCETTRNEARALITNLMNNYHFSESLDVEELKNTVYRIIEELLLQKDILYNLSDIKSVDDYTFQHCVNVCILSLITGIGLDFDLNQLRELGIGAILHDIGKLFIPKEIIQKPSQLTVEEFEHIKKHTVLGYELLKKIDKISLASAFISFGHHERYDGTGYPLQLKGENIHIYARIVAVADVYDALTSNRVYRKKLKESEVYEYITSLAIHHFDPRVVDSFVKHVSIYPVGTGVLLNTGERALVIKSNIKLPTRPRIRIFSNDRRRTIDKFYEIELAEKTHIFIVDGCEL